MLTDEYVKRVYAQVEKRDGDQPEFLQAVREVFESLERLLRSTRNMRRRACSSASSNRSAW